MTNNKTCLLFIFGLLLLASLTRAYSPSNKCNKLDSTPLEKIQVLTLHQNQYTSGLPGKPGIRQLQCLGGHCRELPSLVQCRNMGLDDNGRVQWKCEGQVRNGYSLGKVDVSCVDCGQDAWNNQLVLKGSCAAFVEMLKDSEGSSGYYNGHGSGSRYAHNNRYANDDMHYSREGNAPRYPNTPGFQESSGAEIGWGVIFFVAVVVLLVVCLGRSKSANRGHPSRVYPSAPREEMFSPPPRYASYDEPQETEPGFWSGFAAGAAVGGAGGYYAGKNSSSSSHEDDDSKKTSAGYGGTSLR